MNRQACVKAVAVIQLITVQRLLKLGVGTL